MRALDIKRAVLHAVNPAYKKQTTYCGIQVSAHYPSRPDGPPDQVTCKPCRTKMALEAVKALTPKLTPRCQRGYPHEFEIHESGEMRCRLCTTESWL